AARLRQCAAMLEIERKFLVRRMPEKLEQCTQFAITQGYLVPSGEIEVRLRRQNEDHWLTFKRRSGLVREEINLPLTATQWEELWPLTLGKRLTKRRYEVPLGEYTVEIEILTKEKKKERGGAGGWGGVVQ